MATMRNRIIILFSFLLFSTLVLAGDFVLSGRVTDADGNAIELASVSCVKQGKFAMTNLRGEFYITLSSADSVVVRFSMIGYKTKERVLKRPSGNLKLQIQLLEDDQMIDEIYVTERKRQTSTTAQIDTKGMKTSPSTSGNVVEELIQQQAGVSTHSELSSQYNVRGGAFDENSVYINNVEIYRPFLVRSGQQEGLSIINPDMVGSIGFSTGGYEAKYGDKMSSALDIMYRRPKSFEGNVQASLLGGSVYLGVSNKKVAWANAVRYKTTKALLNTLQTDGEYNPKFIDYQTYLSFTPNNRWNVDFIGNISQSNYDFTPSNRETSFGTQENVHNFKVYFDGWEKDLFRTFFGTLNIRHNFSASTSLSAIGSAFYTKEQETYDIQGQYWLTDTDNSSELGVGTYAEHARNFLKAKVGSVKLLLDHKSKKHTIQTALTMKWENIKEKLREYEMRDSAGYMIPHTGNTLNTIYTLSANNHLNSRRTEFYIQDTYKFSLGGKNDDQGNETVPASYFTLNYGVRFSNWSFNKESIISPRISLAIVPGWNQDITFRLATGLYYQAPFFKELLDTVTVDGQTYATLNEKIKSQKSIHFIAGMDYNFKMLDRPFRFTAEAYYKALSNLVPYSVNNVKVVYYGKNEASGHIAGVDFKLFGEFVPGTDSWLTFSLMNTKMKINGVSIPLPTDQRYSINLSFSDYFPNTDKWKMQLKLAFADGLPFNAPHRRIESLNFRAPAYRRADIGMSYRLLSNERHSMNSPFKNIWLGVDCLNVFGINNVNSYYWVTDVSNQQYAVPNYLTTRQINCKVIIEF